MEKRKLPQGWSWGNMRHAPMLSYPLEAGLYTANKAGRFLFEARRLFFHHRAFRDASIHPGSESRVSVSY